jgi:hypothetical protein
MNSKNSTTALVRVSIQLVLSLGMFHNSQPDEKASRL